MIAYATNVVSSHGVKCSVCDVPVRYKSAENPDDTVRSCPCTTVVGRANIDHTWPSNWILTSLKPKDGGEGAA